MDIDPNPSISSTSQPNGSAAPFAEDDLFDEPLNLEDRFYQDGYQAGFDHGRLHGLFEGRALGQEKCFEIWEEIAYMEGWAELWSESLQSRPGALGRKDEKTLNHAKVLLSLIATFPTTNPTPSTEPAPPLAENDPTELALAEDRGGVAMAASDGTFQSRQRTPERAADDQDLSALVSSIRARYRLLCTSLGARPRLAAAPNAASAGAGQSQAEGMDKPTVVEGIDGPMKGVDTRLLGF